jgi:hypothetical protein
MTVNLDEIPLPDLMQLLGTSKKSGTLVLHSEKVGQLHLRHGEIIHASIGDLRLPALKAAYRMLAWTRGTFALEQEDEKAPASVHLTAQAFLMEGIRQMDELHNLLTRLPSLDARLGLSTPLRSPLQNLAQPQLEVLQAVISAPDFRAALDRSPRTDLETTQDVLVLLKNGYLEIM